MAERQEQRRLRRVGLQPAARPVDTFAPEPVEAPDTGQGQRLQQLGQALSQFNPALTGFFQQKIEQENEEALKQAEADAFENRKKLKEVTRKGLLRQGHNPWYVHGFLKTKGRLQAQEAFQDAQVALAENPNLQMSTDASEISGFIQDQFAPRLEGASDSELEGMLPELRRFESQLIQQHVSGVADHVETQRKQALDTEINKLLDSYTHDSQFQVKQGNFQFDMLTNELQSRMDEFIADGGTPQEANQIIANTVLGHAERNLQPDMVEVLDQLNAGTGKLGNISRVRQSKADVRDTIESNLWQHFARKRQLEDRREEESQEQAMSQITGLLIEDPVLDEEKQTQILTLANQANIPMSSVRSAQSNILSFRQEEDSEVVAEMERGIYQGDVTQKDVFEALEQGKIRTVETASDLAEQVRQFRDNGTILSNSLVNEGRNRLEDLVTVKNTTEAGFVEVENEAQADEAVRRFNKTMLDWANRNNNEFTPEELQDKINETRDRLQTTFSSTETVQELNASKNNPLGRIAESEGINPHTIKLMVRPGNSKTREAVRKNHGEGVLAKFTPDSPDGTVKEEDVNFLLNIAENNPNSLGEAIQAFNSRYGPGWAEFYLSDSGFDQSN